jgi:UDPglucose 6-dehydrogenase
MRIMVPKYMTAGIGDAGACHPRDNIALRWLAQEYDLGYDMFDTIMLAREIQARNMAEFLFETATATDHWMPIVIHGKAYKPNVPYCIGSYSTLIGHYLKTMGVHVQYVDPLADDRTNCVDSVNVPAVILMAHNRQITYGYTGVQAKDQDYFEFQPGSIIVDPFRQAADRPGMKVIHYGNTRSH